MGGRRNGWRSVGETRGDSEGETDRNMERGREGKADGGDREGRTERGMERQGRWGEGRERIRDIIIHQNRISPEFDYCRTGIFR